METARVTPAQAYREWFVEQARRLRAEDSPPASPRDAADRAARIRRRILEVEGDWPVRAPLDPQSLGTLDRDGYRVERLLFQTRAGCYATANVYVPAMGTPPYPAVLAVHGHWAGARRDPVVQSRCIGLAKLGFLVLTLDAWGAGERGTRAGVNEYHGGLLGASLWPVDTPLHGMQLYDNVRALDYLQSRPDVDGSRIGCTGASGGGNQTTYLSAFDERVRCAVPVCSVGTFMSYLSTACCVDEVLRDGLTFAEEGDLLGLVAPRALLVVTASRDAYHFGPQASGEALARARGYFKALGAEDRVRHVVFDSGHAYSRPMREAMYGWMTRWLKGEGDGSPIPEPPMATEDPAVIACFNPPVRSPKVMTTVRWVRERGEELAARPEASLDSVRSFRDGWAGLRESGVEGLREILAVPGRLRRASRAPEAGTPPGGGSGERILAPEPGIQVPYTMAGGAAGREKRAAILLHPGARRDALGSDAAAALREAGLETVALELRGCGELTLPRQGLGDGIPDHNLVEWSLWIGRPLLGQWVSDILRLLRELGNRRAVVVGWREAGLAALLASAIEPRIRGAAAIETLATFVSDSPPHAQRMVVFQPGLLKVGDVPHLAALSAPRPVLVANPVRLDGMPVPTGDVDALHRWPARVYRELARADRFRARAGLSNAEIARLIAEF